MGSYELSGTGYLVCSSYEYIGANGTGSFTQTAGTNTANTLYIGYGSTGNGTYNLDGGVLNVKSLSGGSGTAAFNFGGGTLKAGATLTTMLPMTLTEAGGDANVDTAGYAVTLSGPLSGPGGLDKLDTGTLTLSGANTYGGLTTVSAGTLDLTGASAWNPVVNLGGADITGGQLVFDYSGGAADPEATIAALLGRTIYTTVAGDRVSLFDNTITDQVVLSLVAVPEPSTLILFGINAISLLAFAWRRRRGRARCLSRR